MPSLKKDDNVIPSASEIPSLINSLRHPRKRAVSVGPQSAADFYEAIAYRDHRRRESMSTAQASNPLISSSQDSTTNENYSASDEQDKALLPREAVQLGNGRMSSQMSLSSYLNIYEQMMGSSDLSLRRRASSASSVNATIKTEHMGSATALKKTDSWQVSSLEKPRVRYDVEVVTKLIVYSGMLPTFVWPLKEQ